MLQEWLEETRFREESEKSVLVTGIAGAARTAGIYYEARTDDCRDSFKIG